MLRWLSKAQFYKWKNKKQWNPDEKTRNDDHRFSSLRSNPRVDIRPANPEQALLRVDLSQKEFASFGRER